jgi:hypothetical protein
MDLHRRLHLVGVHTESLPSGILWSHYAARRLHSTNIKSGSVGPGRTPLEFVVNCRHHRGNFVDRFDRACEGGDLATWRTIQAKVRYSMVRSILKIGVILPNSDVFLTNRETIGRRYPFVFFMSIGMVPLSLWIWTIEMTLWFWAYTTATNLRRFTHNHKLLWKVILEPVGDTQISLSFGQVRILWPFL